MPNITTRQYRILSDHMDIYRFMVELYERDWRNGAPGGHPYDRGLQWILQKDRL